MEPILMGLILALIIIMACLKIVITTDRAETVIAGNKYIERYKLTHDGSATGIAITPSDGFTNPIGSYTSYSEAAGVFTFLVPAGTNGEFSFIEFYSR